MLKRKLESFVAAYGSSMKLRGMDGPIDLYLYRPIGYAMARAFALTRATANDVTALSLSCGLAAGIVALSGSPAAFLLCALLYQAANCFDCADGQLARLAGRGSDEGRIIDGLADYGVNASIFAGSIAGLARSGRPLGSALALVLAAGAAKAITCLHYDRAISGYAERMAAGRDEEAFDGIGDALGRAGRERGFRRSLWKLYSIYLRWQELGEGLSRRVRGPARPFPVSEEGRRAYSEAMLPLLYLWSFAGPSAHALYFLVFAAIGRIELYFEASVALLALNAALLVAEQLAVQRISSGLAAEAAHGAEPLSGDRRSR